MQTPGPYLFSMSDQEPSQEELLSQLRIPSQTNKAQTDFEIEFEDTLTSHLSKSSQQKQISINLLEQHSPIATQQQLKFMKQQDQQQLLDLPKDIIASSSSLDTTELAKDILHFQKLNNETRCKLIETFKSSLEDKSQMALLAELLLKEMIQSQNSQATNSSQDNSIPCLNLQFNTDSSISIHKADCQQQQTFQSNQEGCSISQFIQDKNTEENIKQYQQSDSLVPSHIYFDAAEFKEGQMFEESPSFINIQEKELKRDQSDTKILRNVFQISEDDSTMEKKRKATKTIKLTLEDLEKKQKEILEIQKDAKGVNDDMISIQNLPNLIKNMLKNILLEEEIFSNIYAALQRENGDESEKYIDQYLTESKIADYKIISSSSSLQRQAKYTQIILVVACHFFYLTKQDIFSGHGQLHQKFKTIIYSLLQNFLLLIDHFLQLEDIVAHSTNNPSYVNLRKIVNQKLFQQPKLTNLQQMKQNNESVTIILKKLLRTYILKGVVYVQTMLDSLQNLDNQDASEVKKKLNFENERMVKKALEQSQRKKLGQISMKSSQSRSLTPRLDAYQYKSNNLAQSFVNNSNQLTSRQPSKDRPASQSKTRNNYSQDHFYQTLQLNQNSNQSSTKNLFQTIKRTKEDKKQRTLSYQQDQLLRRSISPNKDSLLFENKLHTGQKQSIQNTSINLQPTIAAPSIISQTNQSSYIQNSMYPSSVSACVINSISPPHYQTSQNDTRKQSIDKLAKREEEEISKCSQFTNNMINLNNKYHNNNQNSLSKGSSAIKIFKKKNEKPVASNVKVKANAQVTGIVSSSYNSSNIKQGGGMTKSSTQKELHYQSNINTNNSAQQKINLLSQPISQQQQPQTSVPSKFNTNSNQQKKEQSVDSFQQKRNTQSTPVGGGTKLKKYQKQLGTKEQLKVGNGSLGNQLSQVVLQTNNNSNIKMSYIQNQSNQMQYTTENSQKNQAISVTSSTQANSGQQLKSSRSQQALQMSGASGNNSLANKPLKIIKIQVTPLNPNPVDISLKLGNIQSAQNLTNMITNINVQNTQISNDISLFDSVSIQNPNMILSQSNSKKSLNTPLQNNTKKKTSSKKKKSVCQNFTNIIVENANNQPIIKQQQQKLGKDKSSGQLLQVPQASGGNGVGTYVLDIQIDKQISRNQLGTISQKQLGHSKITNNTNTTTSTVMNNSRKTPNTTSKAAKASNRQSTSSSSTASQYINFSGVTKGIQFQTISQQPTKMNQLQQNNTGIFNTYDEQMKRSGQKFLHQDESNNNQLIKGDTSPILSEDDQCSSIVTPPPLFEKTKYEEEKRLNSNESRLSAVQESICEETLPLPKTPFLPPIMKNKEYTLVLDLDETLIHYDIDEQENEGFYLIRPGALKFLFEMNQYYEIVVFTASIPEYANWIIDSIDPDNLISHRLYRQHTIQYEEFALKDITLLGRPMTKTIIIDNIEENYLKTSPNNGIKVKSWFDEMDDKVLENLTPFLKQIVIKNVEDVRILIKNFKQQINDSLNNNCIVPEFSPIDLLNQ